MLSSHSIPVFKSRGSASPCAPQLMSMLIDMYWYTTQREFCLHCNDPKSDNLSRRLDWSHTVMTPTMAAYTLHTITLLLIHPLIQPSSVSNFSWMICDTWQAWTVGHHVKLWTANYPPSDPYDFLKGEHIPYWVLQTNRLSVILVLLLYSALDFLLWLSSWGGVPA